MTTVTLPTSYQLTRPPHGDDELYQVVQSFWGVTIPRGKYCPHHQAPFDAFATAFFAREPQVLCLGSRGLSGKSQLMSVLGITMGVIWGTDVNIVGGSENQSQNVLEHIRRAWESPGAPRQMIKSDAVQKMVLTNNAIIRPLTASQKAVRGPHPPRLLLDEIDEMDYEIMESAKGQPMPQPNHVGAKIPQQTMMASTLQYAAGTMAQEMARFREEGLPLFEWCNAAGTMISTSDGDKEIENVRKGDLVLTSGGYRPILMTHDNGWKSCVTVTFASGRQLICTPNHEVWTTRGWVQAAALTVGADVGVHLVSVSSPVPACSSVPALAAQLVTVGQHSAGQGQVMSVLADGLLVQEAPHPLVIRRLGRGLQMAGVNAHPHSAQVVEHQTILDGPMYQGVDEAVSEDALPLPVDGQPAVPVAVSSSSQWPDDALVGVGDNQQMIAEGDLVVNVSHGATLLHVYDLTVDERHEYVANGMVVHNCYKDTMWAKDGWLDEEFVEQKKREVSKERWRVEYELGEPSIGNRAIDSEAVEKMFSLECPVATKQDRDFEQFIYEAPRSDCDYVIAADWAQAVDWTVITVWEVTSSPIRCVYYVRMHRRPYPTMVGWFNKLQKAYNAQGIHDATGLGRVVSDMMDSRVRNFVMAGRERDDMLSEFVSGVERGQLTAPKIPSFYREVLYASVDDLYSRGKEFHLPDSFCSAALAWKLVSHRFPAVNPWASPKHEGNWMAKQVEQNTEHLHISSSWVEGEVRTKDDGDVFSLT